MADPNGHYAAGAVANFFLDAGKENGVPITHLKLQKLVSIAYGFYLLLGKGRLFEERMEAWDLGPVVPELYHEFKRFGHAPITKKAQEFDHENGKFYTPEVVNEEALAALRFVWARYGQLTSGELVRRTHVEGTPWYEARVNNQLELDDRDVRRHYRGLVRQIARRHRRREERKERRGVVAERQ